MIHLTYSEERRGSFTGGLWKFTYKCGRELLVGELGSEDIQNESKVLRDCYTYTHKH